MLLIDVVNVPVVVHSILQLQESMFNVGFCVQHHTFSATLDMIDCITAELLLRKVHLGAVLKCATVLKCSGFAKHFYT